MTEPLHFTSSLILLVELQNMKMKFTFSIAFVIAHCIEIIMTMALNQFKNFDIFFTKYIMFLKIKVGITKVSQQNLYQKL